MIWSSKMLNWACISAINNISDLLTELLQHVKPRCCSSRTDGFSESLSLIRCQSSMPVAQLYFYCSRKLYDSQRLVSISIHLIEYHWQKSGYPLRSGNFHLNVMSEQPGPRDTFKSIKDSPSVLPVISPHRRCPNHDVSTQKTRCIVKLYLEHFSHSAYPPTVKVGPRSLFIQEKHGASLQSR